MCKFNLHFGLREHEITGFLVAERSQRTQALPSRNPVVGSFCNLVLVSYLPLPAAKLHNLFKIIADH